MNEPSPETKQAAANAWYELVANCKNVCHGDWELYIQFDSGKTVLAKHFNIATAKLGHGLHDGNWLDKYGACKVCGGEIPHGHTANCDIWKLEQETAKLNKDVNDLNNLLRAAGWGQGEIDNAATVVEECETETAKLREKLERYKKLCAVMNDFGCEGKRGNFVPAHQQPSATTPDVEKLEWKLWPQGDKVIVYQNNEIESIITPEAVSSEQGELLRRKHNRALVQVRALLVKDKERMDFLVVNNYGVCKGHKQKPNWQVFDNHAISGVVVIAEGKSPREAIDVAFTGTSHTDDN